MRKYIQIISFLLAAVTLSGCENWLDVKPETEVNEDDMFNTEQGFMDALYGIYVNMGYVAREARLKIPFKALICFST